MQLSILLYFTESILQIHVDCNLKINGTVHYRNVIVENDTFNISKENFQKIFPIPAHSISCIQNSKKLITKQQNEVNFWWKIENIV